MEIDRIDARVRGVRIAYEDVGSGPVVVRVHGLTGSRAQDDVTGAFAAEPLVRAGLRVVRYDVRGHGGSDGGPVESDYVWANLADDLLALLDVLGVDRVSGVERRWVRRSCCMRSRPHLIASIGWFWRAPPTAWETREDMREDMRKAALSVDRAGKEAFVADRWAQLPPPALADQPEGPVDIDESLLPAVLRGAAESDLPSPEAVAMIGCPTLVLAWADDRGHPISTAERLCALIPGAALHVASTPDELRSWEDRTVFFLQ